MTVEVVTLVLNAASHQFLTLDDNLLAVQVGALAARIPGALGRVPELGNRQAALIAVLVLVLAQGNNAGFST